MSDYFFLSENRSSYWKLLCNKSLTEFQYYVTETNLNREQALANSKLQSSDSEVVLFYENFPSYDESNSEYQQFLEKNRENIIECSDGLIFATSYAPGKAYRRKWKLRGMLYGTLFAASILFSYIIYLLVRIKQLHNQILNSKKGEKNSKISIRGQDEIFELGETIESMRTSLLNLLENEKQIQASQNQLIASLSHDIRTPLTKLIGYLEIIKYHKISSLLEQEQYILKATEKAYQLKSLSDELLNCVLVKGKLIRDNRELVNGSEFLNQILYESFSELEKDEFEIKLPQIKGKYALNIRVDAFQRICDNLSSNIVKYADKNHPVLINVDDIEDYVQISVSNYKSKKRKDVSHHGIGLSSVRDLAAELGGTLSINDSKHQFSIYFTLPKADLNL